MSHDQIEQLSSSAQRILSYWNGARTGDAAPEVSAVDPFKLREWMADISIIEFHSGDKHLYIRMQGHNVARNIGDYDARGGYLEDLVPTAARSTLLTPYHEARRTGRPVYSVIEPGVLEGKFDKFERLILPFLDPSTGECDRFTVWVGPTNRDTIVCESIYEPPLVDVEHPRSAAAKMVVLE